MANYGLRYPVIAQYDRSTGTYSNGFRCGKAVNVSTTVNYVSGSISGDDEVAEQESAFNNVQLTLGTTTLPRAAETVMFGHTVDSETGRVTKAGTDVSNYVGVGVTGVEVVDGVTSYVAKIWTCVKFVEPNDSMQTKGDSITFSNPSVVGTGITDHDGNWQVTESFTTAAAALAYINEFLGITA